MKTIYILQETFEDAYLGVFDSVEKAIEIVRDTHPEMVIVEETTDCTTLNIKLYDYDRKLYLNKHKINTWYYGSGEEGDSA